MVEHLVAKIDQERCTACGLCVTICPDKVLVAERDGTITVSTDSCMACGHCYAVCPVEAIVVPGLVSDLGLKSVLHAPERETGASLTTEPLLRLMRLRRSCRSFKAISPDLDVLTDLVQIGTTAPSATNSQGWQFVVLPERRDVIALGVVTAGFYRRLNKKVSNPLYRLIARLFAGDRLDRYYRQYFHTIERGLRDWYEHGIDLLFHGAPAAIIVAGETSTSCPQEDALLATQNILLAAESMGLATCLIGFVVEAAKQDKKIAASLDLRSTEQIYSVIACGYSSVSFQRFAGRKPVIPRVVSLNGTLRSTFRKSL